MGGLFAALSGWRTVAVHLERCGDHAGRRSRTSYWKIFHPDCAQCRPRAKLQIGRSILLPRAGPALRRYGLLQALPADTPSLRLLADQTAEALLGLRRALDGLLLLVDSNRNIPTVALRLVKCTRCASRSSERRAHLRYDRCGRAVLGCDRMAERRPGDHLRRDRRPRVLAESRSGLLDHHQLHDRGQSRRCRCRDRKICGAAQPHDFCRLQSRDWACPGAGRHADGPLAIANVEPWSLLFLPLLAPANQMSYDTLQFYNMALAIVAGVAVGALAFRLLPPLSPARRIRRLLMLTLRDLRRLTRGRIPRNAHAWEVRIYGRLCCDAGAGRAVTTRAAAGRTFGRDGNHPPAPRCSAGSAMTSNSMRRLRPLREVMVPLLSNALANSIGCLRRYPPPGRSRGSVIRARGSILVISEAVARHAAYFDSGAAS